MLKLASPPRGSFPEMIAYFTGPLSPRSWSLASTWTTLAPLGEGGGREGREREDGERGGQRRKVGGGREGKGTDSQWYTSIYTWCLDWWEGGGREGREREDGERGGQRRKEGGGRGGKGTDSQWYTSIYTWCLDWGEGGGREGQEERVGRGELGQRGGRRREGGYRGEKRDDSQWYASIPTLGVVDLQR